ncbi:MAG: hypothetical protein QG599_340 [Pseudomonadota bacterium]|nr:hypothetical protein [Pseudomonadota bacterium]
MNPQPFSTYLQQLSAALKAGNATEHTHRPALKALVELLDGTITATNEPKRIACGAPDYIVARGELPLGYIEAKDVGIDLDTVETSDQLQRYRASLANLLLTDYLEFRWYVGGERRLTARLAAAPSSKGLVQPLKATPVALESVAELFTQFLTATVPTIATPRELALRLAAQARLLRGLIQRALAEEAADGSLHGQLQAIQAVLLPQLTVEQFSDLYAQTLCYGLFTARCHAKAGTHFTRQHAAYDLPKTHPFLRTLFNHIAGPELNEDIAWAVDEAAELLARSDMAAILQNFGQRTRQEDPVVHFYETFLAEYDPALRDTRGVYYTPEPVVSWLVRSVDAVLKQTFGLPLGLADASKMTVQEGEQTVSTHRVQILDPATGTGTFLYAVIEQIHAAFADNQGLWSGYVREHLLPRLYGFELLMAPYTVAHLKLGLLLRDTGYDFAGDDRLRVYLTNTLEQPRELTHLPLFGEWLVKEARQAAYVKQNAPIMVVLGNPPYSGHSANQGEWIAGLLRGLDGVNGQRTGSYFMVDGQPLNERNPKWLNDDYVKFIRFAQWRIEQTGYGVLAVITNHGYLDNPTFRGMRRSLMETFDDLYLLDLHGNSKKKEKAPDGGKDENVFDIQQGVAMGLFIRAPRPEGDVSGVRAECRMHHAELWGEREGKYQWLLENDISTTAWQPIKPQAPYYLFIPQDMNLLGEYEQGWNIKEIMPVSVMGFQSHRDPFAIDIDRDSLQRRIQEMRNNNITDRDFCELYLIKDTRDWKISKAREQLRTDQYWQQKIIECAYRPFDTRWCYFSEVAVERPRSELKQHVANRANLCLNVVRQTKAADWRHAVVTDKPAPAVFVEIKDGSTLFPLYLYPGSKGDLMDDADSYSAHGRRSNLTPQFIQTCTVNLNLTYVEDKTGDLKTTVGPEDVFHYAYAIFHSPTYRSRYAAFLKIDFPRLPLTSDQTLFRQLCSLGAELTALHLMERDAPTIASYPIAGTNQVDAVRYAEPTDTTPGRVWINAAQYFQGIPPDVWNVHIGGYQVLAKWLKDRKGRVLNFDDLMHYQRITAALQRTLQIQQDIDEAIGEWPMR